MHPISAHFAKSFSSPDMQFQTVRESSFVVNSTINTPIDMPLLTTEVELDSDRPLQFYPDDGLIKSEENNRIASSIKYVLTASNIYVHSKRKIFENAINFGYKKALGGLLNSIRRAGGVINLEFADFSDLDLSDFDLHGMTAKNAIFTNADLSRANLSSTCLICTDLSGVTVRETRFERALFEWTVVSAMTTDNQWIIKTQTPHTDHYPNRTVTNIYVTGKCPADQFKAESTTLPASKTVRSLRCVIL